MKREFRQRARVRLMRVRNDQCFFREYRLSDPEQAWVAQWLECEPPALIEPLSSLLDSLRRAKPRRTPVLCGGPRAAL